MKTTKKELKYFSIHEIHEAICTREGCEIPLEGEEDILRKVELKDLHNELRGRQKVIYGVDDRLDVYKLKDEVLKDQTRSVAGIFDVTRVEDNGDHTITLRTLPFHVAQNLCKGEIFYNQPTGPHCTAFLVGRDLVATAGHCIDNNKIARARFVFGFETTSETETRTVVPKEDVYKGVTIVAHKLDENQNDYALVKLDRPVRERTILQVRKEGIINNSAKVYVMGHPSGLPLKFADGANVLKNDSPVFFTANLDTYGGNSGSPVFNQDTGLVEGILVRGATDFVNLGTCRVSNIVPTTGINGEDITRITEVSDWL